MLWTTETNILSLNQFENYNMIIYGLLRIINIWIIMCHTRHCWFVAVYSISPHNPPTMSKMIVITFIDIDIDIDIDNIYSTYSNWLHIVFMQHNHLKKKII